MGNRTYIRNLARSLIGQLKIDRDFFVKWEMFPPIVIPAQAIRRYCGVQVGDWLRGQRPETMGKIAAFGRSWKDDYGTTLYDVLGDNVLTSKDWGGTLLHFLAKATIVAEITDILLERLTPEQRDRFRSYDELDTGIEPTRGRRVTLHDDIGVD